MKITTFNPQLTVKEAAPFVSFFEELGFELRHTKEDMGEFEVTDFQMKNEDGMKIDIAETYVTPKDAITTIRMNVDNFDEAFQILTDRGFKNLYAEGCVMTETSKSAMMISPTGFAINLVQHIKPST